MCSSLVWGLSAPIVSILMGIAGIVSNSFSIQSAQVYTLLMTTRMSLQSTLSMEWLS